jgi:hypothetical protein
MKGTNHLALLTALSLVAGGCVSSEKSENYLAPTVAGPIPGVAITAPHAVTPAQGSSLSVEAQPLDLTLTNASTSGVRPLSYRFEVASDINFNSKVFSREGVPPGPDNRTTVRLPDRLAPERTYYWRGRAEDGANAGPFSSPVTFNVFTPIVLGKPSPISPSGPVSTLQPRFIIGRASRTGPVGRLAYVIEVAEDARFRQTIGVWAVDEGSARTTLDAPISLPSGRELFWRTRAYEATATGPWSDTVSFEVSGGAGGGGGGGGGGGASCGPPAPTAPLAIISCHRSKYGTPMSESQIVSLLRATAKDFNEEGISGGPFGILEKDSGSNCNGYSCDIICAGQGSSQKQWDVLIDATGIGAPTWSGTPKSTIVERPCEIQ